MCVGVFVVIACRELALLPTEALAAGVVLARIAPAIAAPVAEGFDQRFERRAIRQNAAAFAHRDVVSGIKATRRQVAEGADVLALIRRARRVATILDEP